MRIGLIDNTQNGEAILAFGRGSKALGHDVRWLPISEGREIDLDVDMVAVWGMRAPLNLVRDQYNAHGIPMAILENGYLRRGEYWQVGLNRINWLPPDDLPDDRFKKLGLKRQKKRSGRNQGYVLICGQTPGDAQHNMGLAELVSWYENLMRKIRAESFLRIVWRPHPWIKAAWTASPLIHPALINAVDEGENLLASLYGAHATLMFNSNCGNEALLMGIPVFCDQAAIYSSVANVITDGLLNIDNPQWFDTEAYFNRLAYAQWMLAEIESGAALDFLVSYLKEDSVSNPA